MEINCSADAKATLSARGAVLSLVACHVVVVSFYCC